MVLFKGRIGFKQYMPNKPVKRGYKVWMRADATNGYCCNFEIYTGALQDSVEHGLGATVVKRMVHPLGGKGYHVLMPCLFRPYKMSPSIYQPIYIYPNLVPYKGDHLVNPFLDLRGGAGQPPGASLPRPQRYNIVPDIRCQSARAQ